MKNETDVRQKVEERVYVYMCRSDIEYNCEIRGIEVTKNRGRMEHQLIEAMVKELMEN